MYRFFSVFAFHDTSCARGLQRWQSLRPKNEASDCSSSSGHQMVSPKVTRFTSTPILKYPIYSRNKHIYRPLQNRSPCIVFQFITSTQIIANICVCALQLYTLMSNLLTKAVVYNLACCTILRSKDHHGDVEALKFGVLNLLQQLYFIHSMCGYVVMHKQHGCLWLTLMCECHIFLSCCINYTDRKDVIKKYLLRIKQNCPCSKAYLCTMWI